MSLEMMLINGLHKGLVARNGGAESAIRAQLLYDLERETDFFAFTESDRARIDVTLRPKGAPAESAYLFELKHNFLHSAQIRYIEASFKNAPQQLTHAQLVEGKVLGRYYLHLIVELYQTTQKGPLDHSLVATHDGLVPAYKRFGTPREPGEGASALLGKVEDVLGKHYARYPIRKDSRDPTGHATLYCWLYSVSKVGKRKPIQGFATVQSK